MVTERPGTTVRPQETVRPIERQTGVELPLSSKTSVASSVIADKVAHGKAPDKSEVEALTGAVASDLQRNGLSVSKEDIRDVTEKTTDAFSPGSAQKADVPDLEAPERAVKELDLGEYGQVLGGIMKTYGLEKGKWKFLGGLLAGNEVGWTVLEGLRNKAWSEGLDPMLRNLREASTEAGFDVTKAIEFGNAKNIPMSAVKKALKASWPVWSSVVQWITEGQINKFARNVYMQERAKLEDMVNSRVASSLFMRDFSVFHDQPAGKMMQIINRGKNATVELVATTYFDLVPLLAQIGSYPVGQALAYGKDYGKFAALTAAVKLPILGYTSLKNAREQQVVNARELQTWDKINTELVTTLSNLETLRTAGDAQGHAGALKQTLADRDFVAAGGLKQKLSRDRGMELLFDAMDVGVPMVKNGWDIMKGIQQGASIEDTLKNVWTLYLHGRYAKGEQLMVRQAFTNIMHIYVDRIIPHLQDIQRMEELLGPYDKLDVPNGPLEQRRIGANMLPSYDITMKNVSYKHILQGVNLEIPQGSFTAIKGPSGIGKTTLLRHLVGLYEPDGGSVMVGGRAIGDIKKYGDQALINQIGYAGQSSELLEGWTLRENLLLGTTNVTPDQLTAVIHDLGLDHIKDRLDSTVKHYSGGEKRRIGIARALLKNPKILILDEPTAHLDGASAAQVLSIIQELRKKHPDMTVLAITHDPSFEKIAGQVIDFETLNKRTELKALGDHQVLEAIAKP